MNEIFFRISFVALLIVYIIIRIPFDKNYQMEVKIKTLHQSTERFLLFLISLGVLLIPTVWIPTSLLDGFSLRFPIWVRLIGIALSIVSLYFFRLIHKTLGANWSPTLEIMKGHQLIKTGPYRTIRHPMYAQMFLWTIAQALIISNWVAGFSGLIAMSILYAVRVPKEEKMLEEAFGEEYIRYRRKTGSILPRLIREKS
jgi:protein-S-isoprenylcysteine O-methyltransferase Ste14